MSAQTRAGCVLGIGDEVLSALRDELLSADEAERLHTHTATCAACRERLAGYERVGAALRGQRLAGPSPRLWDDVRAAIAAGERGGAGTRRAWPDRLHGSRRTWSGLGALAAALVVALLFGLALRGALVGRGGTTTRVQPTATASRFPTATATPQAAATGTIYVGSNDHSLYALNLADGSLRWAFATGDVITSRPSMANGLIYVASTDQGVYAVSAQSGQQVWRVQVGWYPALGPVVNGLLFVGTASSGVLALDAASGAVRWQYQGLFSAGSPVVAGAFVYDEGIITGASVMVAFNASDGAVRWRFNGGDYTEGAFSTPVVTGDTLYVSDGNGYVYALGANGGGLRWKTSLLHVNPALSPLAVSNGVIFVGAGGQGSDYHLIALRATDGSQIWSVKTDGFVSAPTLGNGTVYLAELLYPPSQNGTDEYCYALRASNGNLIWRAPLGSAAETLHSYPTSPALADGMVYVGSDDHGIHGLSASDGLARWRADVHGYMGGLLVVA